MPVEPDFLELRCSEDFWPFDTIYASKYKFTNLEIANNNTSDLGGVVAIKKRVSKFDKSFEYDVRDGKRIAVCPKCKRNKKDQIIQRKNGNTSGLKDI